VIIDCQDCAQEHTTACDDCIVPVLLHQLAGPFELDDEERQALDHLSEAGLVAPLRLVPRVDRDRATG
jgi:hypothetical protein